MEPIRDILREKNIVIKGGDALSTTGFTQVPNAVLKSAVLSPGAKLAYAMILSYAWHEASCFPGQARLARDMGVSDRSVRTYLKELETKGLLSIKQRGQGKTNLYTLDLRAKLLIAS